MDYNQYLKQIKRHQIWIKLFQFLLLISFIGLWEMATYFKFLDPFIFSSPSRVLTACYHLLVEDRLLYHIGLTLSETLIGFILGSVLGIAIAILLWWFHSLNQVLEPYLIVLNSLPKTALGPILIVWFGNTMTSIIIMSILICIVITILTALTGFQSVDRDKIKLIYSFGGTKSTVLTKVILPANITTLIHILKVNIGLCLVGVIIGEFLVASGGLGYLIVYGSQVFKLDWVMLSVIILGILSMLFYRGIQYLEKKFAIPEVDRGK